MALEICMLFIAIIVLIIALVLKKSFYQLEKHKLHIDNIWNTNSKLKSDILMLQADSKQNKCEHKDTRFVFHANSFGVTTYGIKKCTKCDKTVESYYNKEDWISAKRIDTEEKIRILKAKLRYIDDSYKN